ncbi:MAG: hypothetical protein WEB58_02600 [Planctomycetaceae bacterium]
MSRPLTVVTPMMIAAGADVERRSMIDVQHGFQYAFASIKTQWHPMQNSEEKIIAAKKILQRNFLANSVDRIDVARSTTFLSK